MIQKLLFSITLLLGGLCAEAQNVVNITDSDIQPGQTVSWTNENVYLLDGLVFVEEGATLNIEAGTVVKFTPRADIGNPSALIISRGGKINAEGTLNAPIIFTAEADDINNPTDLGPRDNALWGGLAILGKAITQKNGNAEVNLEGIPTTEPRGLYGGTDNADNSGVLKYVSIRHGGRQIASGSELNGLSLAAVGSGTKLEYIEVYANSDDGIEFFGGAPNLKYAVVAFAEDDSYDWDEAYTGKGQFWFSIQRDDVADAAGEFDGSTPDDLTPYSNPSVYNWTHIGSGPNGAAANPIGWNLRAGTAGTLANSILISTKSKGIEVQDKAAGVNDAYAKLVAGELKLMSNLFYEIGAFTTLDAAGIIRVGSSAEDASATALIDHLNANKNKIADPGIKSISRTQDGNLDPRPASNENVVKDLASYPADGFFTTVNYKGAFPEFAAGLWIEGWSALDRNGHLKDLSQPNVVLVNDNSINPCENVTWTKDNVYIVDGLTFIEDCATLTIEAGTVVKFTPRPDIGNPSALIVSRGGKIFAEGTIDAPIIFTAEDDDVNDPTDLGPKDNALWGGLAILGRGVTQKNGNAEVNLEGIPTTEPRGLYGGADNADNSGVLKYVSIRHGGRQIASGSELNGLSLAAVGSGTKLEYIEIYANSDDGIEFFGGAPNLKYAVVAFAEDDSYDWDEVYTGKGQFWFSIQRDDVADSGGEFDGTTPDDLTPYSNPSVYNWTHIGSGPTGTAANPVGWNLRAGTAGTLANSILVSTKSKGLEVQDKAAGVNDAYSKLVAGELKLMSNLFYEIGAFTTMDAAGIIRVGSAAEDQEATALINHLTTNKNKIGNPGIKSISRIQDGELDPRPTSNENTVKDLATYPADGFFTTVNYKGAFPEFAAGLWVEGWSALDRNGHLKDLSEPNVVLVNDNSIKACENVTWTRDNVYVVDGLTFVEDCATLTIEAGTVVKFTPRPDIGNPSALVIARGGKIFAEGTEDAPIIFTAEDDNVNDPTDLGPKDNALWGGLAILGKGITQKNGNPEVNLEGIPTTEPRGLYGGTDNADNSGVLKYVSIRHGGRQIASGSELNGLSLAAVGSGTKLEYIEIYANSDDGIEFFGGAPNLKYAVVAFTEDDSYDWDEVYTGKGQFWFSIQRDDVADSGGEFDGTTPDDLTPYSNPTVYNWTHIGSGLNAAAANPVGWNLRAGTAGTIANSILMEQKGKFIEVQDKAAGVNDAYGKLVAGELKLLNNIFFKTGAKLDASAEGIIRVGSAAEEKDATALINHLLNNKTSVEDPLIASISREQDNKLDPRACSSGSAYTTELSSLSGSDAFFSTVPFKGAFGESWDELWIRNWTTLAKNNHLVTSPTICTVATGEEEWNNEISVYPNPASTSVVVKSAATQIFKVEIYTIDGKKAMVSNVGSEKEHTLDVMQLSKGLYLIRFYDNAGNTTTKKLIVE